jgi:hypothetical protein
MSGTDELPPWNARAMKMPDGAVQYVILQGEQPVAFTGDQNFARLVIDLLETHRTPLFQEILGEIAKRQGNETVDFNEKVDEPEDDLERMKAERLANLDKEDD